MNPPEYFLVTRIGVVEGEVRAKCIVCWPWEAQHWIPDNALARVLPSGQPLELKEVQEYDVVRGYPIGGETVYEPESFYRFLSLDGRVHAEVMQNFSYIVLPEWCLNLTLPFFIAAHCGGTPRFAEADVTMRIRGIGDLPDVVAYDQRNRAFLAGNQGDTYDEMMFSPAAATIAIPIPPGCYLPGTLETNHQRCDIAYQICDYHDVNRARIQFYIPDSSMDVEPGSKLLRSAATSSTSIMTREIAEILSVY